MAQDIDKLIPEGAKQDLEDVSKLWDDIVTKVTGYVKEVQKISISPDASRTLISMDESLAKIAESTRRYEKALQDMAVAQQRAAESARQLAKADAEGEKSSGAAMDNVKELAGYIDDLREKKAKLREESQSSVSMWKVLGSSLGSVTGLINLAITAVSFLVEKLTEKSKAISSAEVAVNKYNKAVASIDESVRSYTNEEITHIKVLENLATTTDKSITAKKAQTRAVEELKRLYPEVLKGYDDEAIKAGKAKDAINGLTSAILYKAYAQAAEKKVAAGTEKDYELSLAEAKALKELEDAKRKRQSAWDRTNSDYVSNARDYTAISLIELQSRVDARNADVESIKKQRADVQRENEKFLKDAASFAKKAGEFLPVSSVVKGDEGQDAGKPTHEVTEEPKPAISKKLEIRLEPVFDDSEIESFVDEIGAIELSKLEQFNKKQRSLEEQKHKESAEGRKQYVEELEKYNKRLAQDEINALTEKYGKGKMSEEKYQQGVNEIKLKYATQNLDQSISFLQEELNTAQLSADEKIAIEEHIADLRVKSEEMANEKIIKSRQKMEKMMKDVSKALEEAAVAMYKGIMDSNIKNIEEAQKAADRKKEEDIANVEASVGSEEEKQARIAGINASYEARKTALENQKKQQERKKAEFERALAISKAIYEGASAVVEALPNIPLSVSIGLIAAANIAKMLATPLPGYYKGTDHAAPGLAWVGERGTEAIISKDGSMSLTPDGPTLAYMQGGEQVIPNHLLDGFLMPQLYGQELKPKSGSFNTQKLERKLDAVERAIKNKPVANFHIADGAIRKSIIAGNSKYHYLKKHII